MKKRKVAIIASLLAAIMLASFISLFSRTKTNLNEVALQDGKQNLTTQSTIIYDEVKSGDSDVYYTNGDTQVKVDNFELDAYFAEDGKKVRGVTKYFSEVPNLNLVVNASQFVNLTIKNLRATVSSNKVYPNCTTSAEGIIKEVYGSTVYFNDFQGGSNTTINFAIHEAVDTNSLTENLSAENTVTFKGTCEYIDENGSTVSYPFEKVVDFTVDWTGKLDWDYHFIEKYSDEIIGTDDKVIVSIAVHAKPFDGDADRLINKQVDYEMSNLAINGVKPIDVQVSTLNADQYIEYNYDKTNDVLTYSHFVTQSYIPYGYNSILNIIYPRSELEATINNEIVTKQYTTKAKLVAIGNENISYNNNTVYGIAETEWKEATLNIDIRDFKGKIIDFTNRLDTVTKLNTRLSYSKSGIDTSLYTEVWRIKIALGNYYERLEVERNNFYNDGKDSSCFFDGANNIYYSMDDCKSYRGFDLSTDFVNALGGEDNAKIMVYAVDDSGNETRITTMRCGDSTSTEIVDTARKAGYYWYVDANGNEVTYKQIKFVITTESDTRTIGVGDYWISHYMKIDNNVVKNTYNIDTFDKFTQVHSSTKISGDSVDTDAVEYIMPASAGANYNDGGVQYSGTNEIKLDVRNENTVSYVFDIDASDGYYLQYVNDPTIILELPEQFTSVNDIELKNIEDKAGILTLDSNNPPEVLKQNGRIIIKSKFNGVVQSDVSTLIYKMNLNVPEDEVTTSMPDADIRLFMYSDVFDGTGIIAHGKHSYRADKEQDIYDIDKDGDTTESQFTGRTKVLYLTPSGMETYTSVKATVDGETVEEKCPNVLGVIPNKINKATIDVDLYLFYLDTTISNLKIVGRIPYVDNTFVLDNAQDNLGSTFSTTMTSAGIKVPDDIKNYTTVYYSEADATINKGTATTVNTSIWKTKDQVTDWSKIKSYLIVIDNAITNDSSMNMSTFSYDINLPTEQNFGEKAYATHAVEYVSKVGDSNEELMQAETNKVGISFVTDTPISVHFTKSEQDKTTLIKGAKYELSNFVEGEEIDVESDGTLIYTKEAQSTPSVVFDNLYTGIKYKLTEKEAPEGYEKHDPIVFEIKMDSDGNYNVEIDESNSAKNVVDVTAQKYEQTSTSSYISEVYLIDERSNANYKVKYFYEHPDGTYKEKAERAAVTRADKIGTTVSVQDNDKNPVYDEYELEDTHASKVYEGTVLQDGSLVLKVYFKLKNANYRVEYYYQMSDGSYVQKAERPAATRSDKIGKTVEVTEDDKKPVIANYVYDSTNANNVLSGAVAKDNSLTLKLYFNLQQGQYKVQYYYEGLDGIYAQRTDRKEATRPSPVGSQVAVSDDDKDPKFDNYEFESANTNNVLNGTVTDGTTLTLKVYFKLKSANYRVEYYYQMSDGSYVQKTERPAETRSDKIGKTVTVTEDDKKPVIANYVYDSTNANNFLSGKVVNDNSLTLKLYFNLQQGQYKVQYYYQNADGTYAQRTDRKEATRPSPVGSQVAVTDDDKEPKFDTYEFESANSNNVLTGTVTDGSILTLKVYFKLKQDNYRIEYYYENQDGSYSMKATRPSVTRTGTLGQTVSANEEDKAPNADGYEFVSSNENHVLSGQVIANGGLTLKVFFNLKGAKYTVRYFYQNDDGSYAEKTERAAVERTGKVGAFVNVTDDDRDPKFDIYEFESGNSNNVLSGTITEDNKLELKLYFRIKSDGYKVEYYYENQDGSYSTRDTRPSVSRTGILGQTVEVTAEDKVPNVDGYEFVSSNENHVLSGEVIENNGLTLKVYFNLKNAKYTVRYFYQNDDGSYAEKTERAAVERPGKVGAFVNVTDDDRDPKFDIYEFESGNSNNVLSGTITEDNKLELKLYFKIKKDGYKVEYYYENQDGSYSTRDTRPSVSRTGILGQTVEVTTEDKAPNADGYEFVSSNQNHVLSGEVIANSGLTLKVYFNLKGAKYTVRYYYQNVDGSYAEKAERKAVERTSKVGAFVSVTDDDRDPKFDTYEFESGNINNVLNGTVTEDNKFELKLYFKLRRTSYNVEYYYENNDGSYGQREDRPSESRPGTIGDKVAVTTDDKDPKFDEYEFELNGTKNVLEGTLPEESSLTLKVYFNLKQKQYKVEYYYQNANGTYTQREDRAAETRTGKVYETVNVTNDDKKPVFENYEFEITHASNVLSDTLELNKDTTLKLYFKLMNKQYTVEYYYEQEDGSYKQRADRKTETRSGKIGNTVSASDEDKNPLFNNYQYESSNPNNVLSDTLEVNKTTTLKVYFKFKKATYKVEYYYENTDGTFSQRQDRAPRTAEGTVDEEVSVINTDKDPVFNNYVYDSTNEGNVLTGTVLEGNGLVLRVYFKFKKANYKVSYYYEQNDGTFKQIAERAPVTRVGTVDDTVSVIEDDKDSKNISYEFDSQNSENVLSGTVTEDNGLMLKVYFKFNKANYKVEYYYQNADGKTYSQRSDRQPVVREGIVGREVAVIDADKVSGFTYYSFEDTHADNKLSGTVTDDNGLVLKVYFKFKKAKYTVTYYYEQLEGGYKPREDRPTVTREGLIDHEASVIDEDKDSKINHYIFEADNENNVLSGTVLADDSLALKVYFKFKKADYRVQYYYENRDGSYSQREDRPEETRVGIVDFEVQVTDNDKDPLKNNYVFESDHAENKLSGIVLENNGLVLKVYFKFKIANYTVEYYYENKDGSYNKIATRPDVVRSGIVDDIAEVTTDDKDPRNEYYTFATEHTGNILNGTIVEGDGLVLKVHFRLKKIIYNLDLNKQQTTGDALAGTKFSVYLDDATTPMFDNKEVTSAVELKNQVLYMGEYDLWITENSTAGDPYINILDGKYIRIRMTSTTDEKFVVVGSNNNGNDDFFEVYESDKVTRVTDREILKWIEVIVNPEINTLAVTVKNPIQYNVNVTTVDTLNTFIQGNAYSVYRNDSLLCTEDVTTEIERNEYLMSAGTYDYYFTQNNLKDRYINILNGRFVKVTVNVGGDGKLHIIGAPRLFEGSVGDAKAKEVTAPEITKYITATVNNDTAISSLELHVVYPVTFNVEVDKFKTDNTPLENTEIKISSPIINDQKYVYDNEQISGIDSITADGTVTGTTDYVIDEGTQARVSYAETYVHANANGYYTYEITEVTPAGGQYVNILEGYKVVLRIKVSGDGELTLVDENGNPYADNVAKRFTIVATGDKAVTEDLYDYVFIGIDNNTVKAVLNADVINPIRYKMAVHQSLYGTDGRVKIVNMPVKVNGSDLTNKTIEKSPVWATEKVEYKVTQENPVVDNGLINVLDGYYIGVDINIPGDGDIKTIANNGDRTTNSYRIYKADGTEVNFNQTHIDDFVRVQVTKDNNNVCTVNIYVEVPQEFDVKLQKIDADTKEALDNVEFSMVAKYEGNEIKLKDITKNSDQILTNYLKTAKVDGEYGIIKLNNILIEKAGKYTFVLTETTPDPKPEYRYKDKKGDMVIDFEVTEGNGRYVIKNIKTNNTKYSEAQVGSDNLVKLTVKNERITGVYGVEISKISELLRLPLQGSEFSIRAYKKNADGEDVDVIFYNNVIKTENTQVVPGTIDINSENGINNYKIMIENTDKHFLEIIETKAPDTYTKLAEPIVLKVTPKLVGEYDDAKYVIDTIDFISGSNENLVKLIGYEDEKIKLEITNNQFDLSLRQYVSSINGVDVSRWNSPEIDTSKLITGENTTAEYYNNKMPLRIFAGQEVIYTFRVYNEGQIDGYANEIVAYLPEQLEFLKDDEFNTSRNWEIVELDDETSYLTAIKTNFLSKEVSEDNLIEAFDHIVDDISYREVQVKCKIKDNEEPRQTVTTLAEITKFEAPTRPEAIDRDSNQPLELPAEEELPEYKYKAENENGYVAGDEDDDDFEKVRIEKFDLATEKFVTSINNQEVKDTQPSFKVDKDGNHINYTKTNEDLKIANGNTVEYTIRVYNQGTIDAYADVVEEELPKELIFDRKNPINTKYGWIMLDENRNQTDDITKVKYLSTNYLSKSQGENQMTEEDLENPNLMKDFDRASMESPDYRDVKVALIANLPTEKEGELVNIARVKSGTDSEGMILKDEEPQNDASDEKINIVYFDLSISKWITETVTYLDGKETVDATGFEGNKDDYPLVKIDVKKSKIDDVVIKIKYNIKVTNEGSVPGYAKEITDYIPDGLKLDPADNPNWTLQGNNAVTTELQDKLLAPGETATVSITLTWVNLKENVGLKVNVAEITKDYNEQGDTKDIDSIPGNKVFEEDDLSDTCKMLISIKTGEEQRYTLIIIAVGAIIGIGVIGIKKYVLS